MTEAQKIFRSIFRSEAPPELAERFAAVPDEVFPPISEEMRASYHRILKEVRDLEALEYASRVRGRNQLLTLKFQLMVHLAECHPRLRPAYVNREDQNLALCLARLSLHGARCGWKLAKGLTLLRRYDGP